MIEKWKFKQKSFYEKRGFIREIQIRLGDGMKIIIFIIVVILMFVLSYVRVEFDYSENVLDSRGNQLAGGDYPFFSFITEPTEKNITKIYFFGVGNPARKGR